MKQVLDFENEIVASTHHAELTKKSSTTLLYSVMMHMGWCIPLKCRHKLATQASVIIQGMTMVAFNCFIYFQLSQRLCQRYVSNVPFPLDFTK